MVIIALTGGLGNQMFQYACGKMFQRKGFVVKYDYDLSWNFRRKEHNGYELKDVFGIDINVPNDEERKKLVGCYGLLGKIARKIGVIDTFSIDNSVKSCISFNPEIFKDNKYFLRAFQSEKYFIDIKNEIVNNFTFKNTINIQDDYCEKIITDIKGSNSVSIHVRRGDYLYDKELGGVCGIDYYLKAISIAKQKICNPKFFVFSNDITWCRENFHDDDFVFVDFNDGKSSYMDMQLMTMCKGNIISNSTFSWWGAWLNENNKSFIIAPSKWFNSVNGTGEIIPERWIKI